MRLFFLSCLIVIACFLPLSASNPQEYADSLERQIGTASGDSLLYLYHRLAETYQRIDIDQAVIYGDSAFQMAQGLGRGDLLAMTLNTQGKLHHMKGRYILATRNFKAALGYAEKGSDMKLRMLITNALGISFLMAGEYAQAIEYFSEVEEHFRNIGQKAQLASTLLNIGSLYKLWGKNEDAARVLSEALELAEERKHQELTLKCLSALGKVYESAGKVEEAMKYQQQALRIGEERQYPGLIISTKNSLGQLFQQQGDYHQARLYFQEALEVAREANIALLVQSLTLSLGRLELELNNHWKALDLFLDAELQAEKLQNDGGVLEVSRELASLYEEMGNYQKALLYQKRFQNLQLERNEKLNSERMQELMVAFDAERQARMFEELRRSKLIGQYRTIGISVLAGFAMLAFIFLYLRYRERQRSYTVLNEQHREIQRQNQLLQKQYQEIEEKNQQLALKSYEIKSQNRELKMVNTELTHFARAASHDLREPLRAIRSYMNLLGTRYQSNFDNKAREFLSMASAGAVRMEDLLNDLYQHARVGRTKESFSVVNLRTLAQEVVSDLHVTIKEKNALVNFEHLPVVYGIRTELRMLIQNLLSNALKFTQPDTPPRVVIRGKEDQHHVYIEVQDHGIGIPAEYHEKIFSIFERLNPREDYEGSGIGLATCQKVIEHHEGGISVTSSPGFGTTFLVRLPKKT